MEEQQIQPACRAYEGLLESALEGPADAGLGAHLEECDACRSALDRAREVAKWIRETQDPTSDPGNWFSARVMARIREEGRERGSTRVWGLIESLASRLAMGVGLVLMVLGAYVYESAPLQVPATNGQAEVASEFPQQPSHPADKDEVLASLSGENYGY